MGLGVVVERQLSFVDFPAQVALKSNLFIVFVVNANFVFLFVRVVLESQRAIGALKRLRVHVDHDVTICCGRKGDDKFEPTARIRHNTFTAESHYNAPAYNENRDITNSFSCSWI